MVRTYRVLSGDALYIIAQGEVSCKQQREHPVQSRPARAALLERPSTPVPQRPSVSVLRPAKLHRGVLCSDQPLLWAGVLWAYQRAPPFPPPPGAAASLAPRGLSAAIRAQAPIYAHSPTGSIQTSSWSRVTTC